MDKQQKLLRKKLTFWSDALLIHRGKNNKSRFITANHLISVKISDYWVFLKSDVHLLIVQMKWR